MTLPAALSLAAAALGFAAAVLSFRIARAPGWQELRYLGLLALTAGLYCLFASAAAISGPEETVVWATRLAMIAAPIHAGAWSLYMAAQQRRPLRWFERGLVLAGVMLAILAPIPELVISDTVKYHYIGFLDVTYGTAIPTALGELTYAFCCLALLPPLFGFARAAWRAEPEALLNTVGISVLLLVAVHDAIAGTGIVASPDILWAGFLTAIAMAGGSKTERFVKQARTYDEISRELEAEVERRSRQLSEAQTALEHAERLAVVGRLAAGVAHEINNPATVLLANLEYLQQRMSAEGKPPADTAACIEESAHAVRRVSRIVRQLVDAGRIAKQPNAGDLRPFDVVPVIRKSIDAACVAFPNEAEILVRGGQEAWARGDPAMLEQVLLNLLLNALHSLDRGAGRVEISVSQKGEELIVDVADDGPGIPEELRTRVFEPFFTTKKFGKGTGLGLPVSRGLMKAQRGDLVVASTSSRGTTMRLVLGTASPGSVPPPSTPTSVAPDRKLNLLLIDDDPQVREALSRQLAPWFKVTAIEGVGPALTRLQNAPDAFDVVLCDIMMPDGGGQRFAREVGSIVPRMEPRTIYFTGAATDEAARQFFDSLGPRGLHKPVDSGVLLKLAASLMDAKPAARF